MAKRIDIEPLRSLAEHAEHAHLAPAVEALRQQAGPIVRALHDRTLWMINSTVQGGGVSEMLPGMVGHLNELGIRTEWVVIETEQERFFQLTKRIHNMIHGEPGAAFDEDDRAVYVDTNRHNAEQLLEWVQPGDVVAIHDPQPMPLAGMLREHVDVNTIWRCHIGLDEENHATRAAWQFLEPFAGAYDHAIFSAPEYVVPFFEGRASIIYPALDPLTAKNRPLSVQDVVAILGRTGLLMEPGPRVLPPTPHTATRLQPDGSFAPATQPDDLGLLTRPVITQVSRWDRLKGFLPLLHGFALLKQRLHDAPPADEVMRRRLELARLVFAGPDPDSIADDPEGVEVLAELRDAFTALDADVQGDIAVLALPMHDAPWNALMVNALQRVSTVIVQNSLREGFGLTITEGLWKGVPVLSNSAACGPRQQVRDDHEGRMIADPLDHAAIADALHDMLADPARLDRWGRSAQRRVHDHFLSYTQLGHWLRLVHAAGALDESARRSA